MTCIVGIEDHGRVHLGADSAGVSGYALTVRADQKVFTTGKFVMGFTTSFRMGQLLRYCFTVAAAPEDMDDVEYMSTCFVDAVRSCLKTGGYARSSDGRESGGCFLVGYRGRLYVVDSDYQVGLPADGYAAVGCGADIALGALYASRGMDVAERIEVALDAAERFSGGVRGPFVTVTET